MSQCDEVKTKKWNVNVNILEDSVIGEIYEVRTNFY